jgi:hypothetical protein
MKLALSIALVGLSSGVAAADPEASDQKDPGVAVAMSLVGLGISTAATVEGIRGSNLTLGFGGLASTLITPSFGEWYAGELGTAGMALRAGSAALLIGGMSAEVACGGSGPNTCQLQGGMVALGVLGYTAGIIYDVATAPRAARRYNARHAATPQPPRITPMPTVLTPPSGPVMGLGIGGSL